MKMKFNEQQLKAIQTGEGIYGVSASSGAGKSTLMVERCRRLVQEKGIDPSKILITTFTNASAKDLKKKLVKVGCEDVVTGTFHSICQRILNYYGINTYNNNLAEYKITNEFRKIVDKPRTKDIMSWIGYQKNFGIKPTDDFVYKECYKYDEYQLRELFKCYEELKTRTKTLDFEDWLILGVEMLKKNTDEDFQFKFDYIMVDEYQDSNKLQLDLIKLLCPKKNIFLIFDEKQCLLPTTKILTTEGNKEIQNLKDTDKLIVANGRGKTIESKNIEILSREYKGNIVNIKTKSGNNIKCTPNHMIFVNKKIEKPYMIYLMYKEDWGFRIGFTKQYSRKSSHDNGFETRLIQEGADKVWCLKVLETEIEAKYFEQYLGFKYGIPLYPFKCDNRGMLLKNDLAKKLFNETNSYERGFKLLNDLDMYFEYPHYIPQGSSNKSSIKINFCMFGSKRENAKSNPNYVGNKHELSFCTTDFSFEDETKNLSIAKHHSLNSKGLLYLEGRKVNSDLDEMYNLAIKLVEMREKNKLSFKAIISKEETRMELFPAINIREGMKVGIHINGEIIEDEVVSIEKEYYSGLVYDINVDSYRNYIAEGICVHNCLYGFRGSNYDFSIDIEKYFPNINKMHVSTNYRSAKNIVEYSNDFARLYYGNYDCYEDAIPFNKKDGNIHKLHYDDKEQESIYICDEIKKLLEKGVNPNEISVLYRNNKDVFSLENELKVNEISYFLTNTSNNFFNRKEIKFILAILRLVENINDDDAFEIAFNSRLDCNLKFFNKDFLTDVINISDKKGLSLFESSDLVRFQKNWQIKNINNFRDNIYNLQNKHKNGKSLLDLIDNIISLSKVKNSIEENELSEELKDEKLQSLEDLKSFIRNNTLESFLKFVYTSTKTTKKLDKNSIILSTFHGSKGLEWDNVFVIGLNEKFPNLQKDNSILGECNCFYVATTRAKENMWISEIKYNRFHEEYFKDK